MNATTKNMRRALAAVLEDPAVVELDAQVRSLKRQMAILIEQRHELVSAGFKKLDIVGRRVHFGSRVFTVAEVRERFGDPVLFGSVVKNDGTPGTRVSHIYNWELTDE